MFVPLGVIYAGAILERLGHKVKIVDLYMDDSDVGQFDADHFVRIVEDFGPSIVGFGGIATSYGRTKELALRLRKQYPEIKQIVGGPLASTAEWLLTKANIDVVVHGEAEVSLPMLLDHLTDQGWASLDEVLGISYLREGSVVRNAPAEQIENLDDIPIPAYHLVDLPKYFRSARSLVEAYKKMLDHDPCREDILRRIADRTSYFPIVTGRGCTHRCLFCYRHVQGVRKNSVKYVINHIKYLQQTYGLHGFEFAEELFNTTPHWVFEFCEAIEQNNIDIFYIVGGARVNTITKEMLIRLRDTGCIEIVFGQESGSDTILTEYRKGTTAKLNRDATVLSRQVGLICPVQLVIGSPGETDQTISETIQFMKDVDAYQFSLNYLIPLPETPIWKFVEERRLIPDVEAYLDQVAEQGGAALINLTAVPDHRWKQWSTIIGREIGLYYCQRTGRTLRYVVYYLYYALLISVPRPIRKAVRSVLTDIRSEGRRLKKLLPSGSRG